MTVGRARMTVGRARMTVGRAGMTWVIQSMCDCPVKRPPVCAGGRIARTLTRMTTQRFAFQLLATDGAARRGQITTPHGAAQTPLFMPVATQATVKGLTFDEVRTLGAETVLSNAYHLYLRPGVERVRDAGGLHRFMGWSGPILTDSGGYQAFSMGTLRRVNDDGIVFRSHIDGSEHLFTPESAIRQPARDRSGHHHVLRPVRFFGRRTGRGERRDGTHPPVGAGLPRCPRAERPGRTTGFVRHRPGGNRARTAARIDPIHHGHTF